MGVVPQRPHVHLVVSLSGSKIIVTSASSCGNQSRQLAVAQLVLLARARTMTAVIGSAIESVIIQRSSGLKIRAVILHGSGPKSFSFSRR